MQSVVVSRWHRAQKFLWYQWDAADEKLYVLMPNGALRCYSFPRKEKLQFECPLNVPTINPVYLGFRHFESCGLAIMSSRLEMTLVKMVDGGLCFCMHSNGVITVYIIHHNLRLVLPCDTDRPASFSLQVWNFRERFPCAILSVLLRSGLLPGALDAHHLGAGQVCHHDQLRTPSHPNDLAAGHAAGRH